MSDTTSEHPDVMAGPGVRGEYATRAEAWKNVIKTVIPVSWDAVLLREVYQALAAEDPTELRAGLVRAAGVVTGWVEAIDRRAEAAR